MPIYSGGMGNETSSSDRCTDADFYSPGQAARILEAMARASSHIWPGSLRVQRSHKSCAEFGFESTVISD